jgi:nudix-type nucleoside diphosphatase (YffH/AdpP family)
MSLAGRIRIQAVRVLADDHYVLKKTIFDWRRDDGDWQTLSRETYDRGNGVTLLPYNRQARTVILTRQFRYPAYVNGYDELMIEACAGLLDEAAPDARVRAEVEEETGYRLGPIEKIFECFMSPGSVTEKLTFYVAEYASDMKVGDGGGLHDEGEDIGVLELGFDTALEMIADGRIADAKTVMLLQYAALHLFNGGG